MNTLETEKKDAFVHLNGDSCPKEIDDNNWTLKEKRNERGEKKLAKWWRKK